MPKIGFKPTWNNNDTKDVREFQATYTGKEAPLSMDGYVKWLYGEQ